MDKKDKDKQFEKLFSPSFDELVARLDGYLEAISSMSGQFRDFVFRAYSVSFNGTDVKRSIEDDLEKNPFRVWKIEQFRPIENWITEIQLTFEKWFLKHPFSGNFDNLNNNYEHTKTELIFRALDQIESLLPNNIEIDIFRFSTDSHDVKESEWYAFRLRNSIVVIMLIEYQGNV